MVTQNTEIQRAERPHHARTGHPPPTVNKVEGGIPLMATGTRDESRAVLLNVRNRIASYQELTTKEECVIGSGMCAKN